jgi:hypothetical protein
MIRASAEDREEIEKLCLLSFAETFQVEDLAEIGIGFVGDVDEVGLDEGFGW